METIDIINKILKISFINIVTYFVFIKLINYKSNNLLKIFIIITICIIEASVEVILLKSVPALPILISIYFAYSFIISKITNNKLQYTSVVTFISLAIAYSTYIIAVMLSAIISKIINPNIKREDTAIFFIAIIIEFGILCSLSKIKRFKNGVTFLKDENKVNNIGIIGSILIGLTIVVYSLFGDIEGKEFDAFFLIGILIIAICLVIWIRRKITAYYKQKMKEKTINELEEEIKERDKKIIEILEENKAIATINHKYSNRIRALENFSNKIISNTEVMKSMEEEFGTELTDFKNQIENLSKEYSNEITTKIKHDNKLPKTENFGIDNVLEYMKTEAIKNSIDFNLKINGNINYMVEKIIEQSKLETLIGDHIKDAIIAINNSENTYKSILVIIGIIDEFYEVCIYDTGIEFEIDTLINLGLKAITTHKETGGSGIGFMTTFETINKTKASLIIEEKHPMNNSDYTKAVKIRFDGKKEYRIYSYRAEEIKLKDKDKRIIICNKGGE